MIVKEKNEKKNSRIKNWMLKNLTVLDFKKLQKEIPEKIGISERSWFNYFHGINPIPSDKLEIIYSILKKYGATPEDLIKEPSED